MHSIEYLLNTIKPITEANDIIGRLHAILSSLQLQNEELTYYKPKNFLVSELVPKMIFDNWGDRALKFVDPRISWSADSIRWYFNQTKFDAFEKAGSTRRIYINTYPYGGVSEERGFRLPDSKASKALLTQHKFGRGLDFIVEGIQSEIVRSEILQHTGHPAFRFITEMELDTPHVHIACPQTGMNTINTFKP